MNLNPGEVKDGAAPLKPPQALLAVFPFLLWGLANAAMKLGVGQAQVGKPLGMMLSSHPYLLFNWVILFGLAAGALRGFPRWSVTYLGWALLDVLWWTNLNFYGQYTRISFFFINLMCLPLIAAVLIPLVIRLRLRPARFFVPGAWRDLTLPALGVYLFFSSVYISYDENHHPALLLFVAATSLACALGAWGYFRSDPPLRRALWLTAGLALASALGLWNELTWDWAAYYGFPPSPPLNAVRAAAIVVGVLAAIMLGNGLLAEWVRKRLAR